MSQAFHSRSSRRVHSSHHSIQACRIHIRCPCLEDHVLQTSKLLGGLKIPDIRVIYWTRIEKHKEQREWKFCSRASQLECSERYSLLNHARCRLQHQTIQKSCSHIFSSISNALDLHDKLLAGARDMFSHQLSLIEHTSEIVAGWKTTWGQNGIGGTSRKSKKHLPYRWIVKIW